MTLTNLQPLAYAVAYISFFFGTASIFLRFYCRRYILHLWGWDDNFAILILICSCGQQLVLHKFLYWGCGLRIATLTVTQQLNITKWLFIEEIVYYWVHWVIKSAFLLFYLRLSTKRGFRWSIYIAAILNTAILIVNVLIACFQCTPFEAILKPGSIPGAKCIPILVLLLVPSVLNILEDIFILLIPVSTVWSLQMSFRRKVAVMSLVAFGSSSVIIACCRLAPLLELGRTTDASWVLGKMIIVAALEIQFAIISVNLPSLKSLWIQITGKSPTDSGAVGGSNSKQKGSKNSSYKEIITFGSGGNPYSKKGKKDRRGSITQLEQGITATESEEELCRQGGIPMRAPSRIMEVDECGDAKPSKDYDVKSTELGVDDVTSGHYLRV